MCVYVYVCKRTRVYTYRKWKEFSKMAGYKHTHTQPISAYMSISMSISEYIK